MIVINCLVKVIIPNYTWLICWNRSWSSMKQRNLNKGARQKDKKNVLSKFFCFWRCHNLALFYFQSIQRSELTVSVTWNFSGDSTLFIIMPSDYLAYYFSTVYSARTWRNRHFTGVNYHITAFSFTGIFSHFGPLKHRFSGTVIGVYRKFWWKYISMNLVSMIQNFI